MIEMDHVTKQYSAGQKSRVTAVQDLNLRVGHGEFVVITGRSGSGKSTLLNLVSGLTRPTAGKVFWDEMELWRLSDNQQAQFRNQKIGFVFQFPSLLPNLTVWENVLVPVLFGKKLSSAGRQQFTQRASQLLTEVGLNEKLQAYPRQLSAGQQQRVVIARALVNQPELLLADEPTSNLDEQTEKEVMGLFKTIHTNRDITILLVTHSSDLVRYGSRALQMANGSIVN